MKKITIMTFVSLITLLSSVAATGEKATEQKSKTEINNKTMTTVKLTKEMFLEQVANYEASPNEWKYLGDKPAIIDFYADWCGPCKAVAPVLEELAAEYGDKLIIYKIDTEAERDLAAAFGIRSIPTILFVPMEGAPQTAQGALPKETFIQAIKEVLKVE